MISKSMIKNILSITKNEQGDANVVPFPQAYGYSTDDFWAYEALNDCIIKGFILEFLEFEDMSGNRFFRLTDEGERYLSDLDG